VWFKDRYGVWEGETEDMSSRGCRIVSQRAQKVGALVMLTFTSDRLGEPLVLAGQVVWVQQGPPARAGVAFTGTGPDEPGPRAWVSTLEAVQLGLDSAAPGVTLLPERAPDLGPADAQPVPDLEVLVAPPEPEDASPEVLAQRLGDRAEQLMAEGQPRAAELLLRRALVFAPGDARLEGLLGRAGGADGEEPEGDDPPDGA
jgi:hypothetical protein